jgi:hypothetical protein
LGVIETETNEAGWTTIEAEPDLVGLATDTAVTVIVGEVGTLLGAV